MSKNTLYANEIATAGRFLRETEDLELNLLARELMKPSYTHSERWSAFYDFLNEHYDINTIPDGVITGLAYYVEA